MLKEAVSSVLEIKEPNSCPELAEKLGLTPAEYGLILQKLGRKPNFTELSMFSAMWSEHCSYKNSILLLKDLYSQSKRLLAKPGSENAGALRFDEKYAIVFKVESHNHPSAIEPYQGAATGVGGIMRDIFTMGARPVASLNSLRFGELDLPRNQFLFERVVQGIGDYGNSLGIPCIGGETFFHNSFTKNPIVNAMSIGIAEIDKMASSRAQGVGNLVVYAGAKTGRDGIHGASFASKDLSQRAEEERSAVQVGDPFIEKLLMEACLECIQKKLLVAIQDMGAAGLLSSSSEIAASGNLGMSLDVTRIPCREEKMQPFEFMLSESQERMLLVVEPKYLSDVQKIYEKWELIATPIGQVIEEEKLKIFAANKLYAEVPPKLLTEGAPRYKRESKRPNKNHSTKIISSCTLSHDFITTNNSKGLQDLVENFVSSPNLASKKGIYEQYDTDIGIRRALGPGQSAGVISIEDTSQLGIAASIDCRSDYVFIEPYLGTQHSVAESYRNIISTGATPIGITNCLNFANPYKPENFYYFEQSVKGMSDAAKEFEIPITGGNVSFYNESVEGPVLPTPTIGMVGIHESPQTAVSLLVKPKQKIYLLGDYQPEIRSSYYQYYHTQETSVPLPFLDLSVEKDVSTLFLSLYRKRLLQASIDLSIGGLFFALLKMLFQSTTVYRTKFGFQFREEITSGFLTEYEFHDNWLWGESAHTYLVAVQEDKEREFLRQALEEKKSHTKILHLGEVIDRGKIILSPEIYFPIEKAYKMWNSL